MFFHNNDSQKHSKYRLWVEKVGTFLPTWSLPRIKIAPRWLPDLVVHAFGTFLDAFGTHVEGIGLDFYSLFHNQSTQQISLIVQTIIKTFQIFIGTAFDRQPQNFRGPRCNAVGVFDNKCTTRWKRQTCTKQIELSSHSSWNSCTVAGMRGSALR